MPIRFRCPTCDRLLSTARRKAGTRVACPRCEDEITVPDADLGDPGTAEAEQPAEAVAAPVARAARASRPATARPVQPPRKPGDSGPLFEREDFEKLLGPVVKTATDGAAKPAPLALPAPTPTAEDGITISRGAAVVMAVLMVVLLALAFATGYLVGS